MLTACKLQGWTYVGIKIWIGNISGQTLTYSTYN